MDIKLSQYANEIGEQYINCYRAFKRGELDGAYQTSTGAIMVKTPEPQRVIQELVSQNTVTDSKIPTLKFENISLAEAVSTRANRAADTPIINRFSAIDEGIVPWTGQSGAYNRSGITVRDCVILCQKAFFNISVFSQIIRLLVYLAVDEIQFKGGTKKSRNFFQAYFRKIGIDEFMVQWFLEFWRSGNIFTFAQNTELKNEDVSKITSVYGLDAKAAKKVRIPAKFTIINPADVQVGTYSMYIKPKYYKLLSGYELSVLKTPKTDIDKEVFDSLPAEAKKAIKNGAQTVTIELPSEDLLASFFFKMPYEGLAIPPFFAALDDINWKLQLRKMDIALTRMLNQAILLVTTGAEPDKGGINQNNITNLQQIFLNESVGRVLIADYTTEAKFIIPEIATILDPKKYEAVNNDIYIGLNYILLQGEKFANKQTALQLFIENVKFSRKVFIDSFLSKVIEKVSKELNFKSYPEPYFDEISIQKSTDRDRIVAQLVQYGQLTPQEAFDAMNGNGKLPVNIDESIENQKAYKEFKDEGLYQPIVNSPTSQLSLLKENQKGAQKLQDSKLEHESKQKSADRKHAKENPQSPAPQIVLNAPTKMAQPSGRPKGTGTPQTSKRIKPLGASIISGAKVIENTILYAKLQNSVINAFLEKNKSKSLDSIQLNVAEELSKLIARNEEPKNWETSIKNYVDKPIDVNLERIGQIEEIAAFHQLDPHLASIIFASIKEEKTEKDNGEVE